ncbi:MAG: DASS family sodium-coupled anion symporter [Gemmatimonadales bacterium]
MTHSRRERLLRWLAVLGTAAVILAFPVPEGIEPQGWRMFAIFAATIVGVIAQPLPGGAVVLLGLCSTIFTGVLSLGDALKAYSNSIVWLVLAAIFLSRALVITGLGRRIALHFIRLLGRRSIGLGYAMIGTDGVLATVVPSNGARSGGIIFPIARSLVGTYDSEPGPTAGRLGAFVMALLYQADVVICAMFLTGQAGNLLITAFAEEVTGQGIGYLEWMLAGIVPGLVSLALVPILMMRINPPEVRETPAAPEFARAELDKMGPVSTNEKLLLATFVVVAVLWASSSWLKLDYTVVALGGLSMLLVTGVLPWSELLAERTAWDIFIWYGGLIRLAEGITDFGITARFAEVSASLVQGFPWPVAFAALLLVYFFAHYGFASITAHVTAMFIPFTTLVIAAGAPPRLTVIAFACFSNLSAALTHYGTTPAPIWFGAGYLSQRAWWRLGLAAACVTFLIWATVGMAWWWLLGLAG